MSRETFAGGVSLALLGRPSRGVQARGYRRQLPPPGPVRSVVFACSLRGALRDSLDQPGADRVKLRERWDRRESSSVISTAGSSGRGVSALQVETALGAYTRCSASLATVSSGSAQRMIPTRSRSSPRRSCSSTALR